MLYTKLCFLTLLCLLSITQIHAQVQIPGFTGYASPIETSNEDDESVLFNEKVGLHNWTNPQQTLQYFLNVKNAGALSLAIWAKSEKPGTKLQINLAGKSVSVTVPASGKFVKITVGTWPELKHGFYSINIKALHTAGKSIADIQSIELNGSATRDLHFNAKPRRNAASVHLIYPIADTAKAVLFYNELTIPQGADLLHTYYMAGGFSRGYFGMQVNSSTERRVIFSVWDAGKEAIDRSKVSDDNKVQLKGKGEDVIAEGFGNEGTGGHSHWVYNWKVGVTYKFVVTALVDSAGNSTTYTGYFFIPETSQWKLIASFKAPRDGKYLTGLYSFVENFWGVNGQFFRKAYYGNQWVKNENGQWNEISSAKFSCDATGRAGDRIDFGGGTENGKFYLWNGGFQQKDAQLGDIFIRKPNGQHPEIDLYKNFDSLAQSATDKQLIYAAIANKQIDTTASYHGLYYQIIKPGEGRQVLVTDTVLAFYKGSLLDGTLFDETKDKPASFPLNRLIKGWQIGLPLIRTGGKIKLILPSALAYGIRSRADKIPPNSVLVFEIEVVDTKETK
jgi:hypothetical protein